MNDFIDSGEVAAAKGIVGDLYQNLKQFYKTLDISEDKYTTYRERLKEALVNIQIMGMSGPRPLTDLYVTLRFKGVETERENTEDKSAPKSRVEDSKPYGDSEYLKHVLTSLKSGEIDKALEDLGYGSSFFPSHHPLAVRISTSSPPKIWSKLPRVCTASMQSPLSINANIA